MNSGLSHDFAAHSFCYLSEKANPIGQRLQQHYIGHHILLHTSDVTIISHPEILIVYLN